MAGYVDRSLLEGEKVDHRGRVSPAYAFARLVVSLVLSFIFLAQSKTDGDGPAIIGSFLLFYALVDAIGGVLREATWEYAVTDQRVIAKFGIIRRQSIDLLLTQVQGVTVHQGMFGRLLNFG